MLLFQINAVLFTTLILVSCEENTKTKEENGRQLTKRQVIQPFISNPIFRKVFQSRNPDDSLVKKFLGDGNHPGYTINNGDYTFKISVLEQTGDDKYKNENEDYAEEGKRDTSKNISNDQENYYFQGFYWPTENDNNVKVSSTEDYNEEAIDSDENPYFNYNTSKSFIFTSNLTTEEDDERQKEFWFNETRFYNETLRIPPQRVDNIYQTNESQVKKNIIPVTEDTSEIPIKVETITVNSERIPVVEYNKTLYVSQILPSATFPNLTKLPTKNQPVDIPEDYHRILTPKINSNTINRYNREPQVSNKQHLDKETSSHSNNKAIVNDLQRILAPKVNTPEIPSNTIDHYNGQSHVSNKQHLNGETSSQDNNNGVVNDLRRILTPKVNTPGIPSNTTDRYNSQSQVSSKKHLHGETSSQNNNNGVVNDLLRILTPKVNKVEVPSNAINRYNSNSQVSNKHLNKATSPQNNDKGIVNGLLERLVTNFVLNSFFNNNQRQGSTQNQMSPWNSNTKTNMYNGPTSSHLMDIPRNKVLIPTKNMSSQMQAMKNLPRYTGNDRTMPKSSPKYKRYITRKPKVYNSNNVPQPHDFENLEINESTRGISDERGADSEEYTDLEEEDVNSEGEEKKMDSKML